MPRRALLRESRSRRLGSGLGLDRSLGLTRGGLRGQLGDELLGDEDHHARTAARRRPEGDGQAVLTGQTAHHREAQPGAGQRQQVEGLGGDGLLGAAQRGLAHDQSAVLDGDHDAGLGLLHVDVRLGGRRREGGGVVHDFGERVHDALGGVPGDRGAAAGVQPHPAVGADAAHGAAQNRFHRDRLGPAAARAGPGEHGDAVRETARLCRAVVELEQVAEDLLAVPVLHLPQVGEHAGGQRLDPPGGVGAGRHRGGPHPLPPADLLGQNAYDPPVRAVGRLSHVRERGVHGRAPAQHGHERGQGVVGQPAGLRLQRGDLVATGPRGPYAVRGHGDRQAQQRGGGPTAPGHRGLDRDRGGQRRPETQTAGDERRDQQDEQRLPHGWAYCLLAGGYEC